ncbi:MAG: hypothetical protein IKQ07_04160, partial [Bacteroidaceae bacterium]|nr:hypothetical protein [Bacteroidaceae bacterium]
ALPDACCRKARRLLWEQPTLAVGKPDACCRKARRLLWENQTPHDAMAVRSCGAWCFYLITY